VIFKLENDAAEHIFIRRRYNIFYSYILIDKLFKHLKKIYDDLNKNWKYCCKYNALKQINKSFNVFYFKFMKLFNYFDYDDCILMNDLQNKINNHLQNALLIYSENFVLLTHLKNFLQDVNNRQRVMNHQTHCSIWQTRYFLNSIVNLNNWLC